VDGRTVPARRRRRLDCAGWLNLHARLSQDELVFPDMLSDPQECSVSARPHRPAPGVTHIAGDNTQPESDGKAIKIGGATLVCYLYD